LWVYLLAKKIINRKNKDNEALKEKMAHIPIGGKQTIQLLCFI
jgi:hypothetical protein